MEHDGWRSFESLSTELFLVEGDKGFHIVKDLEWKLILKIRLSNYFQFLPFRWNSNQIWSPRLKCDTIFMSSSKYNYLFFLNLFWSWPRFYFCITNQKILFDVSRIRTCIVRREGTYDDHLSTTTTTAQNSFPLLETKNGYLLRQKIPMHNSAFKINIVAFRLNTNGQIPASFLFYFRIFYMSQFKYNLIKA